METLIIVIVTIGVTGAGSYIVFAALLKRSLKRQQKELYIELEQLMRMQGEELTRRCHERFGKLIADYNHTPPLPTSSRILGLTSLILLETNSIMTALLEQQKEQGYINDAIILKLSRLQQQELWFLEQSIREWLDSRREILTRYNADQGL